MHLLLQSSSYLPHDGPQILFNGVSQLTSQGTTTHEKQLVAQLVTNVPSFSELERLLPFSQKPTTIGLYP
jgi:hypothetical protein